MQWGERTRIEILNGSGGVWTVPIPSHVVNHSAVLNQYTSHDNTGHMVQHRGMSPAVFVSPYKVV